MDNYIIKTLAYNKQVRILFVDNTKMVCEICEHKNMSKLLKTALSKTVSAASLMSGILKGDQRISLKVNASNKSYKIYADADSMGNVRGYLNDEMLNAQINDSDNLSMEHLIGTEGYIQVMKDLGMGSIFTGITEMPYGNIVDDFSHYFNQSEQTPSLFSLNLAFDQDNKIVLSRGLFVQLLPGAPVTLLDKAKRIIAENQSLLLAVENSKDFGEILCAIFDNTEIMGIEQIRFFCGCSKEIFYPMLYSLEKIELLDACENGKAIEIVCNTCGRKYSFDPDEVRILLESYNV